MPTQLVLGSGEKLTADALLDRVEKGGLSVGKRPEDFDQAQLKAGVKVEMEHTEDPQKARKIAMDHLTEDAKYYTKLAQMEAQKSETEGGKAEQAIRAFLKKNPKPDDHQVHALAGKLGMEPDDLEEKIYSMLGRKLEKGERGPRGGNIIGRDKKGNPIYGKEEPGKVQAKREPVQKDPISQKPITPGTDIGGVAVPKIQGGPKAKVRALAKEHSYSSLTQGANWRKNLLNWPGVTDAEKKLLAREIKMINAAQSLKIYDPGKELEKGELTQAKAKKILKDGEVNGHPLTDQQKKFFGAVAGGEKPIQKAKDPETPEEEARLEAEREKKKDPSPPPIPGVKKSGIDDLGNFAKGDDGEKRKFFSDDRDRQALEKAWAEKKRKALKLEKGDDDESPLITVAELGQIIQAGQEHFAKADDGKPGESLKETSTKELAATLKDIVVRLRGDPEDAAALQKRREAIKAELGKRTGPDFGGEKTKKSEDLDGRVYIDEEGTFESIEALQANLEKCMTGRGGGRGRGILEWADQFYNTPWHLQALQCIKDRNECARKQNKMWKDEVPYQDRRQWSGARRGEYEVKREKEHEKYRKEGDAVRERMDVLEAKLIDYRLDQEKADTKKSGADDLDDFAKGGFFVGPRGGKWADAKHTIPWDEKKHGKGKAGKGTYETVAADASKLSDALQRMVDKGAPPKERARLARTTQKAHQDAANVAKQAGESRKVEKHTDLARFYGQHAEHYESQAGGEKKPKAKKPTEKKPDLEGQHLKLQTGMAKIAAKGTNNWTEKDYARMVKLTEKRISLEEKMGMEVAPGFRTNLKAWKEGHQHGKPKPETKKSLNDWIENQEEDDMTEERLAKAGEEVEVEEEPVEQSGLDELEGFAKAQALPVGKPKQKLGQGPEQGGKLAGVGKTDGEGTSGGGPGQDAQGQVKALASKKDKLSEDDADEEGQMKAHKKPIEGARKSVSPASQRDMVAQEQAAAAARLKKGEEDVDAGTGTGTPPEPEKEPELEKGRVGQQGMVQYSEASDLAVERLQKGGDFYTGGSPQVVPFSRPIGVGKECPRCKTKLSKSLTACPECGLGTTVHRVLPSGEAQGDHDGEPIVKSRAGKLRPRIEKDVTLVVK